MEKPLNFLSETAHWETVSEFTTPDGVISKGMGESLIEVNDTGITNKSWVSINKKKIENNYVIHKVSENRYEYTSLNPAFGVQKGYFDISGEIIFSKFLIDQSDLNGYEIIKREGHICLANGALYKGDELINTWKAVLVKINNRQ